MYVQKVNREESIDELCARLRGELKKEEIENKFNHAAITKDVKKYLRMDIKRLKKDRDSLLNEIKDYLNSIEMIRVKAKDENGIKIPMDYRKFLITSACAMFGTCESSIIVKSRLRNNVYARQYIWADIRKRNPGLSLEALGKIFQGSEYDHASVRHNILKNEEQREHDTIYRIKCEQLDLLIERFLTQ